MLKLFEHVPAELQGPEYMVVGQKNHVCLNNKFQKSENFPRIIDFFLSIKKKDSKKLNGARF